MSAAGVMEHPCRRILYRDADWLMQCSARNNKIVTCDGEYIPSEGCCLKHAILFDVWICECEGRRVYQTDYPLGWKRSKFHKWLNIIGEEVATKIYKS